MSTTKDRERRWRTLRLREGMLFEQSLRFHNVSCHLTDWDAIEQILDCPTDSSDIVSLFDNVEN
ncbi:MAG: hypothetical protein V3T42_00390 [Nitrospirales bacterium]